MRHRLLGSSGLRVSELCLGTLGFGEDKDWGTSEEEAIAIVKAFGDAGGSFIDTAPNYGAGRSEEIVGRAISGDRNNFVVGTKFTASPSRHPLAGGNSRRSLVQSVEASLRRLRTDRIDLLWLHFWDGTTPLDEILRGLDDCVSAGKVLYTGLSNTPAWLVSRAVTLADWRNWVRPAAIQVEYNLAARDPESDLLPMADALGLGVLCWGPLAAGALAGGKDPKRRAASQVPSAIAKLAAKLDEVAEEAGYPPHVLALAWLARRNATLIPVLGARTVKQLSGLLEAVNCRVDPVFLDELSALAPPRLGYPHDLIGSSYLRRFALGDPDLLELPPNRRA